TAENNWWGSANGPEHAGNTFNVGSQGDKVSDNVDYVPWFDALQATGISFAPVNNTTDSTKYSSIQAAINAATGTTITCAAGTYNENVTIDKSLTLNGAQHGVTAVGRTGAKSIINAADGNDYVVKITADTVTLDGFTITGRANAGENQAAVITWGVDSCTITNNILTDNYKDAINLFSTGGNYSDYNTVSNNVINGPNGHGATFGIKIKGSHNTISGNHVYNTDTPIHIWSWDQSETASPDYNTISGNTIAQGVDGTADYKYGINIKTGHYNVVTGNTITGAEWAAIYLYTSDRMETEGDFDPRPANDTISGNTITGGEVGIALLEGANTNTISGNNISGTSVAGILGSLSRWPEDFTTSPSSYLVGTPQAYLQITNNTIENNTLSNCGHGIAMEYGDNNTLTTNTITNNTSVAAIDFHGVNFVADAAGVYFDANSSGNVAHYNDISGNTGYGLKSGAAFNAKYNWWGDVAGPSITTNPYNDNTGGDAVSTNVDYIPWLIHTDLASGWNIYSTPIALDSSCNTIGDALDIWTTDSGNFVIAYYFDSSASPQAWVEATVNTSLTPLQAIYVKMNAAATIDVWNNSSYTAPPSQTAYAGWNLIGLAELYSKAAEDALASAYYVAGANNIGYSQVVSPGLGQTAWSAMRGSAIDTVSNQTMAPCEGYWVFMVNQGTLAGFTSTPIAEQ
ncbi:MAG: right-handed parallel beta-helix repeat-containing protein, partial [Candidatus Eisenbacteria sp.]|nr:right-handed parallel beta-helix repeat-containing protein [Candidatus Eisenbacteria bacterium]